MDAKKIGIIAVVVIALVVLIWSFKSSFISGQPAAGQAQAEQMKKAMDDARARAKAAGPTRGPGGSQSPSAPAGQ